MKKVLSRLLIITLMFFIVFSLSNISRAEDTIVPEGSKNVATDSQNGEEENLTSHSSKNYNYFGVGKTNINITEQVEGDVFVVSGGTVTIDAYVSGNVFVCAPNVVITNNTQIDASLFVLSQTMILQGQVEGNVFSMNEQFNLENASYIKYSLFLFSQKAKIDGFINSDANISSEKLEISNSTQIDGDLNYSAKEKVNLSESTVAGNVHFLEKTEKENNPTKSIISKGLSIVSYAIFVVILFLLLNWIKSKIIYEHTEFKNSIGKYILFGLLGIFIVPIASLILLLISLTSKLGFLLLLLYILMLYVSSPVFIICLSNLIAKKNNENNTFSMSVLFVILLSLAYQIIKLIPVIGTLVSLAIHVLGFGLIFKTLLPSKEKVAE